MLKKEEKAWLLSLIIVAGFAFSVVFHYRLGYYLGATYPRNTFLFNPADAAKDFHNIFNAVLTGSPYSYKWSAYFPFTYIPLFALAPFRPRIAYAIFATVFISAVVWFVYKHLQFLPRYQRLVATFILSFLSYPFLFCLDRGNVECLVFVFLYLFLTNYQRNNSKRSVLFLSCAIAMKLYPGVFVVLFLARKQYREVFGTGVLVALLTLISAAVYPTGVRGSFQSLAGILNYYKQLYVLGDGGLAFGSGYFGLIKVVINWIHPISLEGLERLLPFYTLACLLAFSLLSLYVIFREQTFWKKVAILTFAMILFPQVSADYKLIHVLFPLLFFIASTEKKRDVIYSVLFGLLLIPKAFFWIKDDVSISVVINPLLITLITLLIMAEGLFWQDEKPGGKMVDVEI